MLGLPIMRMYSKLLVAAVALLPLAGCHSTSGKNGQREQSQVRLGEIEATKLGDSSWNTWRAAMTPSEKAEFDRRVTSEDKLRYVRGQGIDVRVMLRERLKVGMSLEEVGTALEGAYDSVVLGDPREGWMHASVNNGAGTTLIDLQFEPETWTLVKWQSHVKSAARTTNSIEATLQSRLDKVLSKGMGQSEITTSHERALKLRSDYERKMTDRRNDPNYAGYKSSSSGDYATEAAFDRANGSVQFWDVLNRTPEYIRREGAWEYWYHKVPLAGQTDKYVVIEYRFENKRLESWWVYSTDFLGFSGFN